MLLGFGAFSEYPISSAGPENSVTITVTANTLAISIGDPGITADAITEIPTPSRVVLSLGTLTVTAGATVTPSGNSLVISSGTVTITADANISPTGSTFALGVGTVSAITWSEIIPGISMTWTPIDPN